MAVKLLISGTSNSGKTTLLSSLTDAFVISHDGKNFPFPIPHTNIADFKTAAEFIKITTEKLQAYKAKFGKLPATVAIDSSSKIFDTLADSCNTRFTGFHVFSNLNKEIHEITEYVQNVLIANGMNVVLISHAIYDSETTNYALIGKGDFSKRGGFLAETDTAIFLETKNNKRIVHHKSTKFPARTLLSDMPDSEPVESFSLQAYIDKLSKVHDSVTEYEF